MDTYRATRQWGKEVLGRGAAHCVAALAAADHTTATFLRSIGAAGTRGWDAGIILGDSADTAPLSGGRWRWASILRGRRGCWGAGGRRRGAPQHGGDELVWWGVVARLGFAELGQHPEKETAVSSVQLR